MGIYSNFKTLFKEGYKELKAKQDGNAIGQLLPFVMGLVVVGIFAAAGALALNGFRTGLTAGSAAINITDNALTGVQNTSAQFGTAGTIAGVGLLLAIVGTSLYVFMNRQA